MSDDIANLANDLANDATEIKCLLKKLDEVIRKMYKDIEVDIPSSKTKKIDYQGWAVDVIESIEPFIVYPVVAGALEAAAVTGLLSEGLIGEAALVELVGLPAWLGLGVVTSGIVIVVGIELLIAGIAGAVKRDKLQEALQSAIQPRIKLKKAALINDKLQEKLQAVKDSCAMMIQLGYTKENLDAAQKNIVDEFKADVAKITEATAKDDLAALDKERGSWTNEDY